MRRALAILLSVAVFAPHLSAQSTRSWENVEKLKPGTPLRILLWNGEQISGKVDGTSETELRLIMRDSERTIDRTIDRSEIRRIVRIRHGDLPDPDRWMIRGALIGGAIGVTQGAIRDSTHHSNQGSWLTGGLAGAVLGFFASCAALTGVGVVALVHHDTVVYEDRTRRT